MNDTHTNGFSLVEIMVGLTLGVIMSIAVIGVYIAQKSTYRTNVSQALIQNAESAISELMIPSIRSAGFVGCTTALQSLSNLNPGGPPPIGTLGTTPSMIMGYGSIANPVNIIQANAANSTNNNNWLPALDQSLNGSAQPTSDVLVVFGAVPGSLPVGVTTATQGSSSVIVANTTGVTAGQFGGVSDCLKASVFAITSVAGSTISHTASGGALANANNVLLVNYPIGSQFIPLTQTAFFVAHDPGGQSSLVRATLNAGGTWTIQSLVPGVDTMKVLYGVGASGTPTQYVSANSVTNWGQVAAIRLGFLIEGQQGSSTLPPTTYSVLGTTVNVPADNKLRHVHLITINIRNSVL